LDAPFLGPLPTPASRGEEAEARFKIFARKNNIFMDSNSIMPAVATLADFPLRIGHPKEFACVRTFFREAAFDDVSLCRALKMGEMSELGRVQWQQILMVDFSGPLRWFIQVFLRGLPATEQESRSVCGDEAFAAFLSLGLLRPAKRASTAVVCPVWVYPADGFVVASDRHDDPDGEPYTPPEDVVFPAIYAGTLRFLRLLPLANDADALDLCGGSGIGALRFSRTARTAVTADVTERAAHYAEFNARLNDARVTSLCGDLYAPVPGRQFDVISAHPPFVPATGPTMAYRDGGDTGEEVIRRTVEGLPDHLRSGGTCVILCVARDTEEGPFEKRAAGWLGVARDEFDVLFGLEKILSVEEVVESIRKRGQQVGEQEARQLFERLRSLATQQFVYGALVIRRFAKPVVQEPLRIHLTPAGDAQDFDRLLEWRRHCRSGGFDEWLAKSRPRLAPRLQLTARHVVQDGELIPVEFVFSVEGGFQAALRPDAWVVPLVARLTGQHSVEQVFEAARIAGELPDGFTLGAFADLARRMIERGFLEVE
jgi:methylase of polypeptide subunit release factors